MLRSKLQLLTSTSALKYNYPLKLTSYHSHRKIVGKSLKRKEALWIDYKDPNQKEDGTPFRFTGKERDLETGLYYYGARYLDPKTSRWMSADPAMGEYVPQAGQNISKLSGMGGVYNTVNLHTYHYSANNPVRYVDPDGRSTWIKIIGTDWWFRYDQASAGDKPHFHFLKGNNPRSAKADVYNRRVYPNEIKSDGSTVQCKHGGSGKGGRGGVDRDVPEDIIGKATKQKGAGVASLKMELSEPLFGLLGIENLDPSSLIVLPISESYPIWGNGNPLQLNYSVTRNKETGDLNFKFDYAVDQVTGDILFEGMGIPFAPMPRSLPTPSLVPVPRFIPIPVY